MKLPDKKIMNNTTQKTRHIDFNVDENDQSSYLVHVQEKEKKFVNYVERIIRSSFEYKRYIQTLKSSMDLTQCKFFSDADLTEGYKVSLEMHHYPFTLYDIVLSYHNYIMDNVSPRDSFDTFALADDIMRFHYEGHVCLVPLSVTAHELAHSGELFIPLNSDYVFGNIDEEVKDIHPGDSLMQSLNIIKDLSAKYKNHTNEIDLSVLDKSTVNIIMRDKNIPTILPLKDDDKDKKDTNKKDK